MLQPKQEKYHVGVIVARFQVPALHDSHKELIRYVLERHPKNIIFLGNPPTLGTRNNPLDFEMRKQMILTDFPDINVLIANDCVSDEIWSKNLDNMISSVTTPNQKVLLYGGRDSFLSHYRGRYPTLELDADKILSGTEIRQQVSVKAINSPEFRAGVVWAQYNQYPKVFPTVDVAIMRKNETLLARKPNETLLRFVGGFSEPESETFELDAMREVQEETGIAVSSLQYLGSFKVSDWRYKKEVDKIKTLFFVCDYIFNGNPFARDDIAECGFYDLDKIKETDIVEEHRPLFKRLLAYVETRKTIER